MWASEEIPRTRLDVDDIDRIRACAGCLEPLTGPAHVIDGDVVCSGCAAARRLAGDFAAMMERIEPPVCAFCCAVEVARPGEWCSPECKRLDQEAQDATDDRLARPWEFVGEEG